MISPLPVRLLLTLLTSLEERSEPQEMLPSFSWSSARKPLLSFDMTSSVGGKVGRKEEVWGFASWHGKVHTAGSVLHPRCSQEPNQNEPEMKNSADTIALSYPILIVVSIWAHCLPLLIQTSLFLFVLYVLFFLSSVCSLSATGSLTEEIQTYDS